MHSTHINPEIWAIRDWGRSNMNTGVT